MAKAGSGGSAGSTAGTSGTMDAGMMSTNPHPNSKPEDIDAVCKTFVDCDLIPGKNLTMDVCKANIEDACVACAIAHPMMGGGNDGGTEDGGSSANSCPARGDRTCSDPCGFLIAPPADKAECLEIQATSPQKSSDAYNDCLCTTCLPNYQDCKGDHGCWEIIECAVRAGCTGTACYTPQTCMSVIDAVGNASISTIISMDFGTCTAKCPK
jgi:hypothetical protein